MTIQSYSQISDICMQSAALSASYMFSALTQIYTLAVQMLVKRWRYHHIHHIEINFFLKHLSFGAICCIPKANCNDVRNTLSHKMPLLAFFTFSICWFCPFCHCSMYRISFCLPSLQKHLMSQLIANSKDLLNYYHWPYK